LEPTRRRRTPSFDLQITGTMIFDHASIINIMDKKITHMPGATTDEHCLPVHGLI
jgi:hypothetical protein